MAPMSMKKTDLEKFKAKKLSTAASQSPDRFGKGSAAHANDAKDGQGKAKPVPLALKLLKGLDGK